MCEDGDMEENSTNITIPVDRTETKEEAERMAYLEKPARDFEIALKNEKSEEKSLLQKENVEVMKKMLENFPHAFEEKTNGEQRVLIIRDRSGEGATENYALTENGIFGVDAYARGDVYNRDKVYDVPYKAIDFFEVSRLMGDKPNEVEKNARGVIVEQAGGAVIDEYQASNVKARIRRMKFVEDDSRGGTTAKRFMEYIKKVNENHKNDELQRVALEESEQHSMFKLLGEI